MAEWTNQVVDSHKNVMYYLNDACSMGGYLLTTECVIADAKMYTPSKLGTYNTEKL